VSDHLIDDKARKIFDQIIDLISENLKPDELIEINGAAVTTALVNVMEHHLYYCLRCLPPNQRFPGIEAFEEEFSLIIEKAREAVEKPPVKGET
jgi:hypothetical protein